MTIKKLINTKNKEARVRFEYLDIPKKYQKGLLDFLAQSMTQSWSVAVSEIEKELKSMVLTEIEPTSGAEVQGSQRTIGYNRAISNILRKLHDKKN